MSDAKERVYFTGAAYGPENAEAHRRVMEWLRNASRDELLASLVASGLCDEQGRLRPPYADEAPSAPAGRTDTNPLVR